MSVRADTAPSIKRATPPVARTQASARAAGRGPVVNFDLPPRARLRPEPTCAKPQAFAGGVAIGEPIGTNTWGAERGLSVGGPVRTHIGSTIPTRAYATAPQARGDRDNSRRAQACNDKRKSPPPDEGVRSPPPPKPNFGGLPSPQGQRVGPTEGKPTSLMQPQPLANVHPFTPTLKEWQHRIEVDCGPDWAWDVIEAAVAWGPHPTACTAKAIALFKDDIKYQRLAGFCKVSYGRTCSGSAHRISRSHQWQLSHRLAGALESSWTYLSRCTKKLMVSSRPRRKVSTTPRRFGHQRKRSTR
jgi:hypothetical protein